MGAALFWSLVILLLAVAWIAFSNQKTSAYHSVTWQGIEYFSRAHSSRHVERIVNNSLAWAGPELREDEYLHALNEKERAEIVGAMSALPRKASLGEYRATDLGAVPLLDALVARLKRAIKGENGGRGFFVVRGVPLDEMGGEEEARRFFWLLGQRLGIPGAQDNSGELLASVKDVGGDPKTSRQYRSRAAQEFHVDAADAVGLLCLQPAVRGGISRVASSVRVFNELVSTEQGREHARTLYDPLYLDTRRSGGIRAFKVAPLRFHQGVLRTVYHTEYFRSPYVNYPDLGVIPPTVEAALNAWDAIANTSQIYHEFALQRGDAQFVSNHALMHYRGAYEDDPARKRHLLRLWLTWDDGQFSFWREWDRLRLLWSLLRAKWDGYLH